MADGGEERRMNSAREPAMALRVGVARAPTAEQRMLGELRQVGRELLDNPVPKELLDLARAAREPRD